MDVLQYKLKGFEIDIPAGGGSVGTDLVSRMCFIIFSREGMVEEVKRKINKLEKKGKPKQWSLALFSFN